MAVAVDGSYACEDGYPPGIPYVAANKFKLVELAHDDRVAALPRRGIPSTADMTTGKRSSFSTPTSSSTCSTAPLKRRPS